MLASIPIIALFALLTWGLVKSDNESVGLIINSNLDEISVENTHVPSFQALSVSGADVTLPSKSGRFLMLDFWSSWCPPCKAEAPLLSQIYREYQPMPVDFVGIAIWDDANDISRFVEEFDIPYPIIVDINGQIAIEYGVKGIPEKFFIGPSGTLLKRYNGPMDATTLRSILDELLAHPTNED